ncbi:MAG: prenyltransferase/squalene oxidase repeat-containing protein [bacterium]
MSDVQTQFVHSLRRKLLSLRDDSTGVWTGELSSSALSTALALVALMGEQSEEQLLSSAQWLQKHQNEDGGWGDTPTSQSNISTTLIARAALCTVQKKYGAIDFQVVLQRATDWVVIRTGGMEFPRLVQALSQIYKKDRTFAIPILTFIAICENDDRVWPTIPSLPFILALLPQSLYRFFRIQVVSYALPALIAIGLCRSSCAAASHKLPSWWKIVAPPLLRKLEKLQPLHGGFLDAIPLTAFVAIALTKIGYTSHPVVGRAKAFLKQSYRPDGSYAIDTNLRTWVTSLTTRALLNTEEGTDDFPLHEKRRLAHWIIERQQKHVHPYTGAQPGGWAWTDCAGGVPDADDTSAALIALYHLQQHGVTLNMFKDIRAGIQWLMGLQNHDGGMPTFCKGWGRLPFDRSCPDISAHALLACVLWREQCEIEEDKLNRLLAYLKSQQKKDGSWFPLWFGHQEAEGCCNPVVGTARVVDALQQVIKNGYTAFGVTEILSLGISWILHQQHVDGSWGAGPQGTNEETALAVIALKGQEKISAQRAVRQGCLWLIKQGLDPKPAPIGLYFSLLWYTEKMYPLTWTLEALAGNITYE